MRHFCLKDAERHHIQTLNSKILTHYLLYPIPFPLIKLS